MGLGPCDRYQSGYRVADGIVIWYPHRDAPWLLKSAGWRTTGQERMLPDTRLPWGTYRTRPEHYDSESS